MAAPSAPLVAQSASDPLAALVGGQLSLPIVALALLLASGLGAAHAISPGHGKTLVAAYLVGSRGSVRQAATLGITVAATHTTGVLVLGSVLWLTQSLAPDRLLPWLTAASGVLLAIAGATLLLRRLTGRAGLTHGHHHHPHHEHAHEPHAHGNHDHGDHAHASGSADEPEAEHRKQQGWQRQEQQWIGCLRERDARHHEEQPDECDGLPVSTGRGSWFSRISRAVVALAACPMLPG